ncbi:MAG: T9SS type A sorting domain-containing protein [Ignavibacteriae bacterium]|nr:T9SS type A sorting domain-containing protein [Ignavibacteriota bacterium]
MKTFTYLLLEIIVCFAMTVNSYSSIDTLPPNPVFEICPCCGVMHYGDAIVEDMPKSSERSNLGSIVLDTKKSFNFRFTYDDFAPGVNGTTKWSAEVTDKDRDARLVVTFTDFAGNDTAIQIDYIIRKFTIKPELDFGLLAVGESKELDCWIKNESSMTDTITRIDFKSNTQGFDVNGITLPYIINSGDSVKVIVGFTATWNGEFRDSIAVISNCHYKYKSLVQARVGSPIIDVRYVDYGDVPVNSSANGSIEIRNYGNVDLIITGYTGPRQPFIFIPDLFIEPDNPLRLTPGQVFSYEVRFLPTDTIIYTDSMFFVSNSEKDGVDSIGELNGRGIKPDLTANSYDWGRRRIDRQNFPAGPYDPDNNSQVIQLTNSGTMGVTIYNIRTISDVNGNAFEFDRGLLTNRVINPKEKIYIPVIFHPNVPGPHELILGYDNSAQSTTQTILRGIGTVPQIIISDYDFGSTLLNDTLNPSTRIIRITNKSASDWHYGDTVTIFDLISVPNGNEIATDPVSWGTEGFRYDKSFMIFPLKLAQGEYIEFVAQFVANKDSQSTSYLKTVSDAEEEVTSKWSGTGIIDDVDEIITGDNEIKLSPNPADDFLTINLQDIYEKPLYIKLFDSYGNTVYEDRKINDKVLKIRTNEFASGMYFLKIENSGMRKILVIH